MAWAAFLRLNRPVPTRRAYARAALDFGGLTLAAGLSWLGLNAIAVLSKARNRDKAVILSEGYFQTRVGDRVWI